MKLFLRSKLLRFRSGDDGAALVEFAIVLPVLLLMLFGIIGWGASLSMHNAMYDTARSCARGIAIGSVDIGSVDAASTCRVDGWTADFAVDGRIESANAVVTVATPNPLSRVLPFIPMPADLTADVVMPMEAGAAANDQDASEDDNQQPGNDGNNGNDDGRYDDDDDDDDDYDDDDDDYDDD